MKKKIIIMIIKKKFDFNLSRARADAGFYNPFQVILLNAFIRCSVFLISRVAS